MAGIEPDPADLRCGLVHEFEDGAGGYASGVYLGQWGLVAMPTKAAILFFTFGGSSPTDATQPPQLTPQTQLHTRLGRRPLPAPL